MKFSHFSRAVVLLSSVSLLFACSTPFKNPAFESRPSGETKFHGISQLVAVAPNHTLDVLMVHGMCTHSAEWAKDSIKQLNLILGGEPDPQVETTQVDGTQVTLYQSNLSVDGGNVRTSALVWSPVVAPLKHQLCADQTKKSKTCTDSGFSKPAYPYERATFNRKLKDRLLNDCLADAIIYQGKSRDAIVQQVQKAILTAVSSLNRESASAYDFNIAATESTPLVFITESLGSKITFDAIYKLIHSEEKNAKAAGLRTFDRTALVFMGANQMPILALADQSLDGTSFFLTNSANYPTDPLAALIAIKKMRPSLTAPSIPKVIAFSDPNDLFSYILVPSKEVATYDVVDVVVSNKNTYFGFFEPPETAHTTYLANPSVMRLIACGTEKIRCGSRY
ncbi:hypothetical protein [Nitrosospira sp. NpAV]|uniref:hypothetical protein n=1 Tax=Nitrosospira sp. NpAV TaxID=58133 RepID=UPI0005A133F5|nr:hypothetical protein [Nitrosospira sp. NpAV]KIO50270.1 hypothetical protein SQ11_00770 [Nitrosospira sp. NpAV]